MKVKPLEYKYDSLIKYLKNNYTMLKSLLTAEKEDSLNIGMCLSEILERYSDASSTSRSHTEIANVVEQIADLVADHYGDQVSRESEYLYEGIEKIIRNNV